MLSAAGKLAWLGECDIFAMHCVEKAVELLRL